jgi:8-oxo-dGTP pyrophosphatase MutT (NUDIX family)
MRPLTAAELREALARHPLLQIPALPGRRNDLLAGVLVPLVLDGEPEAILTLRAAGLARHPGEVCFPGGKLDAGDADLRAAALREAREELGIAQAEILGQLAAMPLYTSDFRLVPYVAAIPAGPLQPAAAEVAAVLRLPLLAVLEQPEIEGLPFVWNGVELLSPVFFPEGRPMFGATAHTFYELLAVVGGVLGRRVPRVVRSALTWSELRPDP